MTLDYLRKGGKGGRKKVEWRFVSGLNCQTNDNNWKENERTKLFGHEESSITLYYIILNFLKTWNENWNKFEKLAVSLVEWKEMELEHVQDFCFEGILADFHFSSLLSCLEGIGNSQFHSGNSKGSMSFKFHCSSRISIGICPQQKEWGDIWGRKQREGSDHSIGLNWAFGVIWMPALVFSNPWRHFRIGKWN